MPVGVHWRPHNCWPLFPVLRCCIKTIHVHITPLLYVIQPFSSGSSSSVCTLHIAEDDGLSQSVVTHSAHVSEEVQLSFHQPLEDIYFHSKRHFNFRFSAMANRMAWSPSLSRDLKCTHSLVVCLRLEGNLVNLYIKCVCFCVNACLVPYRG